MLKFSKSSDLEFCNVQKNKKYWHAICLVYLAILF